MGHGLALKKKELNNGNKTPGTTPFVRIDFIGFFRY